MVEESMGSLGIDSRCLDIRVTAGREEERSTTKLLATSWKEKDKTTFRTFLLVQNSNSERKTRLPGEKALPAGFTAVWPSFSWK